MMKMHIEATEAPHCTFSNRVRRKLTGFLRFFVFYNLAQFHHNYFNTFYTSYGV